ncbi:MAG: hypothetical protein ABIO36_02695 [Pyrinomonadaceae bacterium]
MINLSTLKRFAFLSAIAAAIVLFSGHYSEISAQRDPFQKPGYMKVRTPAPASSGKPAKSTIPVNYDPPMIEARIEYYKRLRETAAANGTTLPKVTSVLTLNEMAVTGIFKTPRGYAAMVEATPIKLSYTIYPGEKFFDGQLVAVEENRLVFRKVTKVGEGKFVASVENKPLKQFSTKAQIEGTAPTQSTGKSVETASNSQPAKPAGKDVKMPSNPFASPLDEMNKQPAETDTDKSKKVTKKPVKVAKNRGH